MTAAVHGFHVYKEDVWEPTIREVLLWERDVGNRHDTFVVAIKRNDSFEVVGHVPSSICLIFIRRGGEIDYRITGTRRYSADLPQGEMEEPCILIFKSQSIKECNKTEDLIKSAKSISSEELPTTTGVDSSDEIIK